MVEEGNTTPVGDDGPVLVDGALRVLTAAGLEGRCKEDEAMAASAWEALPVRATEWVM